MSGRATRAGMLLVAVATLAVHLPFLTLPLEGDDFSSFDHAARSLDDPAHFFDWVLGARLRGALAEHEIAGIFRVIPKLTMMGGLGLWGLTTWPFRLLNLALHLVATALVGRLAARRIGGAPAGLIASGLFGIGLGSYTSAVSHVSNVTMLLATVFLLLAIEAWERGKRRRAAVIFGLALLSHEIAGAGVVLLPFLTDARPRTARMSRFLLTGALVALALCAVLLPGGEIQEVAQKEIEQGCFLVLPLNPPRQETLEKVDLGAGALASLALRAVSAVATHRLEIGLALLCATMVAVLMSGRRRTPVQAEGGSSSVPLAVAWVWGFILPVAILMTFHPEAGPLWEGGWLQRRYLYLPGIGAALLAAVGLGRLAVRRRRAAVSIGLVLSVWVLGMGLVTWLGQRANREENTRRQIALTEEIHARSPNARPR